MAAKDVLRWSLWVGAVAVSIAVFAGGSSTPRKYPDRKVVRFWHRWQGDWKQQVEKIVQSFNQSQEQYEVVAIGVPSGGADAKFTLGVIGGDPPDLMSIWSGAVPSLASSGFLTKLETLMTPDERKRFFSESYASLRETGMFDGHCYGVTIGADLMALYVNDDHVRAAGFDPENLPDNLEDFQELGLKLNKYDAKGNLTRLGLLITDLMYLAPTFGGGFDSTPDGGVSIDTPENLRALKAIVAFRNKVGFDKVVRFDAGLNDIEGAASWAFMDGNLSITYDGQWRVEELRRFKPNMKYRVVPIPPPKQGGKPRGGQVGGNYMIVPISAKQKDGAWQFLKFWTGLDNADRAAKFYNMGGWLPYSPAVANSPTFQAWLKVSPQFQAFLDILGSPNCKAAPAIPNLQFLTDLVRRAEDAAVRGTVTPEEALKEAQRKFDSEREKRRALGYPQ